MIAYPKIYHVIRNEFFGDSKLDSFQLELLKYLTSMEVNRRNEIANNLGIDDIHLIGYDWKWLRGRQLLAELFGINSLTVK